MSQLTAPRLPIIDMHCDLLVYLADVPESDINKVEEIGCAAPALTEGNVKLQVMAIYSPTGLGSTRYAELQRDMFRQLADRDNCFTAVTDKPLLEQTMQQPQGTGMVVAIENASGLCEQLEPLEDGFKRLEKIIEICGRVLYISFTHHAENRFGGGNNSTKGITRDGKMLLDYLHGRNIAVDMSHTSDALATDILNHIDRERLAIPIIASHSNFRPVWNHERNLPDEITQEIIRRKGLIGMNFLRKFVNTEDPDALLHHIQYGLGKGAEDALCFGADYFYFADEQDQSRFPFYFKEHEQAGTSYSHLLQRLQEQLTPEQLKKLAYQNAQNFIARIWS
ncbi:dipeptidase [Pontibacter akesuensis]|uniref:Zn-dependent dipeptidase, dipeptidase homolog n=1 Tax=Pontibacter akesuensis TaxID=388950 RepID=A0A1I7IG32_9BACT|nr:membrane dipeptidase [Pontibacter akesuensis]GHA67011.1 peptidase M19 [Pontibacter akesuensis]SFU71872.1 Zn-dependent dipeptidase, dipeptidase homolog [Pontibacter akesuensis]